MDDKPKAGRPPGRKNKSRAVLCQEPTRCPRCDGTEFKRESIAKDRRIHGFTHDGKPYNRILWRRARCVNKACRQHLTIREFHFDASGN